MTRIHINASTPYDVVIEEGALQRITDYIKPLKPKRYRNGYYDANPRWYQCSCTNA